jgi:hypothetical protein
MRRISSTSAVWIISSCSVINLGDVGSQGRAFDLSYAQAGCITCRNRVLPIGPGEILAEMVRVSRLGCDEPVASLARSATGGSWRPDAI